MGMIYKVKKWLTSSDVNLKTAICLASSSFLIYTSPQENNSINSSLSTCWDNSYKANNNSASPDRNLREEKFAELRKMNFATPLPKQESFNFNKTNPILRADIKSTVTCVYANKREWRRSEKYVNNCQIDRHTGLQFSNTLHVRTVHVSSELTYPLGVKISSDQGRFR